MVAEADTHAGALRSALHRWLSPALFALIALAFLLPFATVACDNARTTFSGIQLATHAVPHGGNLAGDSASDCKTYIGTCVQRSASNTATVAFVVALLGLALGLVGVVRGPGWCALLGLGAMLALPFEGGVLGPDIYLHSGYYLATLGFLVAVFVHLRRAARRRRKLRIDSNPLPARYTDAIAERERRAPTAR
jgi:hypothetical protein